MIRNLPPELRDLEIHIQRLLAEVKSIREELEKIDKRLKAGGL